MKTGFEIPNVIKVCSFVAVCICIPCTVSISFDFHPHQTAPFWLTQMSSWVMTTLAIAHDRCRAVRPSPSPYVSLTSSLVPCASSSTTNLRSSSTTARSSCCPRGTSDWGSPTRNSFCSYLARIQRSFSSLEKRKQKGYSGQAGQNMVNMPWAI